MGGRRQRWRGVGRGVAVSADREKQRHLDEGIRMMKLIDANPGVAAQHAAIPTKTGKIVKR